MVKRELQIILILIRALVSNSMVREMVELTIVLVKLSEPVSLISNFALDACYKW